MITPFVMFSLLGSIQTKSFDSIHAKIGSYDGITDNNNCGVNSNQRLNQFLKCVGCLNPKRGQLSQKLVNAESATNGEFPWMASFQSRKTKKHFCSGTVINSNWIITAAHCFKGNRKVDTFYVRTGSNKINSGTIDRVHRYYLHPKYNLSDLSGPYDLALVFIDKKQNNKLELKKKSDFNVRVNGICLPEKDILNDVNENAYYSGFGRIHYKGVRAKFLMKSAMTLLSDSQCANYFSKHNMACLNSNTSHTCKGDSGSPLVQYVNNKAVLIGIHKGSTKTKGKCGREIAVTTRVSKFIDWIVETIKNHQNLLDNV